MSCSICLEDYSIKPVEIPYDCIHIFHEECIKKWEGACPICRFPKKIHFSFKKIPFSFHNILNVNDIVALVTTIIVTLMIFYLSFITHDKINSLFRFDVPSITMFNHRIDSDGKYIFRSWQTYKGGINQNKFNGYGVLTFKDGDVYRGQFTNGMMHGHGEIIFSSSSYMKYSLPNNTMYHSLISKYTGDVYGNMMHGWAKVVFDNGDVYTGEINGNSIHGFGTMIYKDGIKRIGNFNYGRYYK